MILEDLGVDMDTVPAERHELHEPLHDPIVIGESIEGVSKFWGKVDYLAMDDSGNIEKDDSLIFHIFAASEEDAKQRIKEFFESLNRDAEKEGLEFEISNIGVKNMNTNSISAKELQLFNRWRKTTSSFVVDGVVDEAVFLKQQCKIVLILKEANQMGETALNEFLRNGAPGNGGHTWNPVCRWLTGEETRMFSQDERKEVLRRIAVMNLKKKDGGSTTDMQELATFVEADKEFIAEQLSFYSEFEPVIFVCCGPWILTMLNDHVLGQHKINRDAPFAFIKPDDNREVYYVAFNHPNCRKAGMVRKFHEMMVFVKGMIDKA